MIFNLYKPVGISPLNLIERLKKQRPELKDEKMTYAGRLDPMAEGVVLILSGEDRFEKDEMLGFDKKYRAEILLGVQTDTHDILGLSTSFDVDAPTPSVGHIEDLIGFRKMPVPAYSSVIVDKRPLFEWARKGGLDQIEIPEREMSIHSASLIESRQISSKDLLDLIHVKISKVQGDFRQDAILKAWNEFLDRVDFEFSIAIIDFHVSSGTYIRSIAHELGGSLLSLKRTHVGKYSISDSIEV